MEMVDNVDFKPDPHAHFTKALKGFDVIMQPV